MASDTFFLVVIRFVNANPILLKKLITLFKRSRKSKSIKTFGFASIDDIGKFSTNFCHQLAAQVSMEQPGSAKANGENLKPVWAEFSTLS